MIDFALLFDYSDEYMEGLRNTLYASLIALAGSFMLGTVVAVMRMTPVRALRWLGTAYVEFFRNIPLLLVVYIFFLGLPALGIILSGFVSGTIGLTVYTSAYLAEAIRAGIMAVPKGQSEAARSSGLSYMQTMRHVVLPQAIKIVVPPISNQFLNLVKNSSILGVVSGFDLMFYADIVNSETYQTVNALFMAGLLYLLLTFPLSYATRLLEKRLARTG
ncbi:MAG TPA: amino acid ABC transporter permease [Paenibacillus sp.]|uniref:amino acid ABC transporter permease n=1 Tax=Paenibacillus sp. TaxID=58172 RepID=UPI002BC5D29F|nr:amino acid ABC transporter permease [Paenibacillus sp.]HUC92201.1 amino acid ABC transporter permease [Paenibacillus sp.]